MCTLSCGGYLHGAFCGVQEWKKKQISKTAYKTHMCQKCAAVLGKTELVYKPPIAMDKEESESSDNNKCSKKTKTKNEMK
eukprot:1775672-Ditylum_brightwellii.AAC.1